MGLLDRIVRGLTWFLCGPKAPYLPEPEDDVYVPPSVPHKPKPPHQGRPPPSSPPSYNNQQPPHAIPQPHPRPPQHRPSPPHGPRVDQNQVNQQNEHYTSLRARASAAGDEGHRLSEQSQAAYKRGEGALAKELSNKCKERRAEMDRLNKEAAEWIFIENNKDSAANEVDLHGLQVKEALEFTERALQDAQRRGDPEIHLIVGKGLHSEGQKAKIKPAVEELMVKYQLVAELDPHNAGVLIVSLDGKDKGTGQVVQPDDIARGIESREDRCVIM
ncbi:DUF1771-domain-containing protein [Trametopsis cervina]|nr:DUF1771-domain-containing protein [Trametopsis cervina]